MDKKYSGNETINLMCLKIWNNSTYTHYRQQNTLQPIIKLYLHDSVADDSVCVKQAADSVTPGMTIESAHHPQCTAVC